LRHTMPRRSARIAAKMAAATAPPTTDTVIELNTDQEKRLFMIKMLYAVHMRLSPVFEEFGRNCYTITYSDPDEDPEDIDRLITQAVKALDKIQKFSNAGTTLAETVYTIVRDH
jgi:hypothetical protein